MFIRLPHSKTYIPGPGKCIYCPPGEAITDDLGREHIIARKLGGELILHKASCLRCAGQINKEIEAPMLTKTLLSPRTHLSLPTSKPRTTLPMGRWKHDGSELPKNLSNVDIQEEEFPLNEHMLKAFFWRLAPPGILTNSQPIETFHIIGVGFHSDNNSLIPKHAPSEKFVETVPFNPAVFCRMIAKIAHGAAVAELGMDSFEPLLPDIIMGRSPYISYLVGSLRRTTSRLRNRKKAIPHEITLKLQEGFLVATVQLFANLGMPIHQAVVGLPSVVLSRWYMNSSLSVSKAQR